MVIKINPAEPANHIAVFQESSIQRVWRNEEWWFSVVDVCAILTASPDAGAYWRKLKQRLNAEGSQPVTFCHGLKLLAPDGRQRETDCANTEGLFLIIQSIPSPKAAPFKRCQLGARLHSSSATKLDTHAHTRRTSIRL
jgi:prophage antirepressor-like protein